MIIKRNGMIYEKYIDSKIESCIMRGRRLYESEITKTEMQKQIDSAVNGKIDPSCFKKVFLKSYYRMVDSLASCYRDGIKYIGDEDIEDSRELDIKIKKDSIITRIINYFKKNFEKTDDFETIDKILTFAFKKCFYTFLYEYTGVDSIKNLNDDDKNTFRKFIKQVNSLTKNVIDYYKSKFKKHKVESSDIYDIITIMADDDYRVNIDDFVDKNGDVKK